jgi:phosphatidylinositol alpha-mannosyltransferase
MRVGVVCPYSWDVPGGVQYHVRDLSEALLERGHEVSVLAPADEDTRVPSYVVPAGRAVRVPYNGSVARVNFGPISATRVRRWLRDGAFDVLHIHEPVTPSLSVLACWAASGPIVATFHTSNLRSRAMAAAYPILEPALEKITARVAVSEDARRTVVAHIGGDAVVIPNGVFVDRFASAEPALEKITARVAVSEDARRTVVAHIGGDAVVIPNGVFVDRFASAEPAPEWAGRDGTLAFIGRLDEPRKGLPTLLAAMDAVLRARPGVRLLVVGRGDAEEVSKHLSSRVRDAVVFLGQAGDADKARLLRTADVYVAPNLGGESFGVVLVEAMSAGTPVLASDLDSFRAVLDGGRVGRLFAAGDVNALAAELVGLLDDPGRRDRMRDAAAAWVRRFDWSSIVGDIVDVYETAAAGAGEVREDSRGWRDRLRR